MVTFWNSLTLHLLLEFYQLSIVRSVSNSTIHVVPGDEVLFNCSEYLTITIKNVSVQNTGECKNRQDDCNLNKNDHELIKRCEGYPSCFVNGSLLTSSCLWEDLHFDLSYICKASYEYVGCYVDNSDRVLDEDHKNNEEMSADICVGICTEKQTSYKHKYFGTQSRQECFCGDGQRLNSEPYLKMKDSECNMYCLQHEDEKCGGEYRMSVYKILPQISRYHPCLEVDQQNWIEDCKTSQLQEKGFCVKFNAPTTDLDSYKECTNKDYELGNQLYQFCRNTTSNGNCVYNLASILQKIDFQQTTKYISIGYACKVPLQTTDHTPFVERNTQASIPVIVVSVLVVVIFAALVFIILVFYKRRQKAKKFSSSEKLQKEFQTDSSNSSATNTGMTYINIPSIYENINDNKIINCGEHKQEGNYETLSTNRRAAEPMYASTEHESTEPSLSRYQSLTNPPESDIHTYASTELDSSQYQSLTNPNQSDIHTYASTASIQ
ncbi:uncharacterized protein LOC134726412 [Mytilus trossulus]|uniref:uncharacterized protein LOC134726412 n=1 Tax=Mytilus trossulus TaxID=6551 RepID=UPI0030057531